MKLLLQVPASPRLLAHLTLVYDAASTLIEHIDKAFPGLSYDRDAVLFGAAVHDIGKTTYNAELEKPGKEHEPRGYALLQSMGVPERRARFAYTHGNWSGNDITFEDLLVALADKSWKGKRIDDLESKTVNYLAHTTRKPAWTCYAELDEILQSIAQDALNRMAWMKSFSASPSR